MIPVGECIERGIYRLRSRNLLSGVFVGGYFLGIRCKFDDRYLDYEVPYERGGTAEPVELLGVIPEDVVLKPSLGSVDKGTRRAVDFDKPVDEGGLGWYFVDTGESSTAIRPESVHNARLWELLKTFPYPT